MAPATGSVSVMEVGMERLQLAIAKNMTTKILQLDILFIEHSIDL